MKPKFGDLRIWWIPQVPGKPFYVHVNSLDEAILIAIVLAKYDQFQYEQNVKPDYSNAGGLQEFDGENWLDWYSSDGDSFDEYLELLVSEESNGD